jgi:Double zinc ribbon
MTRSSAANPSMRSTVCAFCKRINPPDSKYCNACGTPLGLVPCASCGAVNDPAAPRCHECAAALPGNRLGEPAHSSSATEASGAAGSEARTAEGRTQPIAQPSPGADGLDGLARGLARWSSATEVWDAAGSEARTAEGRTQPIAQPSLGADGLDRDARHSATLQELVGLLANSHSGAVAGRPDGNTLGTHAANADVRTAVSSLADALSSCPAVAIAGSPAIRVRPRTVPRRGLAVVVGTVVLAVLAAAGYYAYRERPVLDFPQVPAASGAVKDSDSPAATGALVNPSASAGGGVSSASTPALAVTPPVAADDQPIALAPEDSVAVIHSGTAPPGDARSPATGPFARSSGGTTVGARRTAAEARDPSKSAIPVPAVVARPRSADAGRGILERQPARVAPCTEAVAALGLCAPEAIQRRD